MNIYRHIPDLQNLEREYSPSSRIRDIHEYLQAYTARSELARAQFPDRLIAQYGASAQESLDFFPAPSVRRDRTPRPVLVYIHGGYWQELTKDDHSFLAEAASRQDFSYIAVGYGLAPVSTLEEMVERCRRALAWIGRCSAQLAVDPEAIHLAGSSAGAHLAAMCGLSDWTPYGLSANPVCSLTLLSGVFDLRPVVLTYVNDALRLSVEGALTNSPLLRVDNFQAEIPPALVVYGDNETAESKRQSSQFAASLTRRGYLAELHEIRDRNHFDLPFDIADETTSFGAMSLRHFAQACARRRDTAVDSPQQR